VSSGAPEKDGRQTKEGGPGVTLRDEQKTSWTLLQRLHDKDEGAWRRFMDEYFPRILARSRKLLKNQADAEELASEVLAELVQQLPRFTYDPGRSFRAWLQAVIQHTYLDWQRRKRARVRLVAAQVEAEFVAPAAQELATAITGKTDRLTLAMAGVRSQVGEQRWGAFWAYLTRKDVTAAEVGEEFGMTAERVRVDFGRILKKLRGSLAAAAPSEEGPS
jgi:RNA polymerase sigma-70 factor (ECF subfamily)